MPLDNSFATTISNLGQLFDPKAQAQGRLLQAQQAAAQQAAEKARAELAAHAAQRQAQAAHAETLRHLVPTQDGGFQVGATGVPDFMASGYLGHPEASAGGLFDVINRNADVNEKSRLKTAEETANPSLSQVQGQAFQTLPQNAQQAVVGPKPIPLQAGGSVVFPAGGESVYQTQPGQVAQPPAGASRAQIEAATPLPQQDAGGMMGGLADSPIVQLFMRLADAEKSARFTNTFSHDEQLGWVPKAEAADPARTSDLVTPYRDGSGAAVQPLAQGGDLFPAAPPPQTSQTAPAGPTWQGNTLNGPPKPPPLAPPQRQRPVPSPVIKALSEERSTLDKIAYAIKLLPEHPNAIGLKTMLGDTINQRVDPDGVELRAIIAEIGNAKLHDESGAAVTNPEWQRHKPNLAHGGDNAESAMKKLLLMQRFLQSKLEGKAGLLSTGYALDPSLQDFVSTFTPKTAGAQTFPTPTAAQPQGPAVPQGNGAALRAEAMSVIQRGGDEAGVRAHFKQLTGQDL